MIIRHILLSLLMCLFFTGTASARVIKDPPKADQVFQMKVMVNPQNQLIIQWDIAQGYHLYRDKIIIKPNPNNQIKLSNIELPPGEPRHDEIRGDYEVYAKQVIAVVSLQQPIKGLLNLTVGYQGCSLAGFCYAPIVKEIAMHLPQITESSQPSSSLSQALSEQGYAEKLLAGHTLFFVVFAFLGLGLLLAFTPCVLPLVPILSGIIAGHNRSHLTAYKAFMLSLSYVIGMALAYMILGMIVALLGSRVQSFMQNPLVISLFGGFFVMLAGSLLGFYTFQFPARWQKHLMRWDRHLKGGTYPGVFLMGCFSSLIVSPCVSAPLVGVLAYIAQSGNVLLGALALFALGIGMGIPLLLVGASAGKLLPKSGEWMISIQRIFGLFMLGVAVWLMTRIVSETIGELMWAGVFIIAAIVLGAFKTAENKWERMLKVLAISCLVIGIILGIGFENSRFSKMWDKKLVSQSLKHNSFLIIKDMSQLNQQMAIAKQQNKFILLDFHADWCASCKRLEKEVFADVQVQQMLKNMILLQADITHNSAFDQLLLNRYHVVAPPTLLFFGPNGAELISERLVGEISKKQFIKHIQTINQNGTRK
jgi:thiol:disulfide interchange protein DsbD